jgi:hypothetical protein
MCWILVKRNFYVLIWSYLRAESERDQVSGGLEGEYRGRGHSALQPGGREPVCFRPDHTQVPDRENREWNWVSGESGLPAVMLAVAQCRYFWGGWVELLHKQLINSFRSSFFYILAKEGAVTVSVSVDWKVSVSVVDPDPHGSPHWVCCPGSGSRTWKYTKIY